MCICSSVCVPDCMCTVLDCWEPLQERFKVPPSETEIRDVYDGAKYKEHSLFLSTPQNVSLLINTDGVAIFRSSAVSVWPVWIMINELPRSMRYGVHVYAVCTHVPILLV